MNVQRPGPLFKHQATGVVWAGPAPTMADKLRLCLPTFIVLLIAAVAFAGFWGVLP